MIAGFGEHYGIQFKRVELLKLALTHRSYLSVSGQGPRESNERLEFLGDSVLGLVTSEFLYREHPNEHEGQLTKTKSLLVSKAILSRRALAMGLGRFVLMSHSEVESGGRQRLSILADAFESVVGAVYLDQGFEASREFIIRWLLRESRAIVADKRHTNFKSHLQEFVQSTYRTHPVYRIRSEMGPDHSKQFNVEVLVGRRSLGVGKGRNKKEAEQAAARDALEKVGGPPGDRPAREPRREAQTSRADEPDSERVIVSSPPRRRGRRGGRGRGDRETPAAAGRETPAAAGRVTPAAGREAPVHPAPRSVGAPEMSPATRPSEREEPPRARELEPAPRYDEDENEEVGRPEGPLEERHIDPFAIETEWGEPAAVEDEPAVGAAERIDMGRGIRRQEDAVLGASARDRDDVTVPEPPASRDEPATDTGKRSSGPEPYGRKPGRSRRGSR